MSRSAAGWCVAAVLAAFCGIQFLGAQGGDAPIPGWEKGVGWGWIWGSEDEVGSLNAITPASVKNAVGLIREGKIYDLGVTYDRNSYKWPGHSPGEIIMFRSPEGVKRQRDLPQLVNPAGTAWHSCALFINDNVATQIDGLGHATTGDDNHWYNGFKESDWGGDWGPRKCDGASIPPVVTRGVLLDVPKHRGKPYVTVDEPVHGWELEEIAAAEGVTLEPGDAVMVYSGREIYAADNGGTWGGGPTRPGLHASCLKFVRENDVSILGWDMMDAGPNEYDIPWSVHGVIFAYGVALLDNSLLEPVANACKEESRYEFMLTINPLNVIGGTGSPVNPIAVF